MRQSRAFLSRHRRALIVLAMLVVLASVTLGAFRIASDQATSVDVTIGFYPDNALSSTLIVVYNHKVTDEDEVQRIQRLLNGAKILTVYDNGPVCGYNLNPGSAAFYAYDFRFSIGSVTTQEFSTERGACTLNMRTLGIPLGSPLDTGHVNPLSASAWSSLLSISPALPDVPAN